LPVSLNEKEFRSLSYKEKEVQNKAYSHNTIAINFFALANPHKWALLLMIEITLAGIETMFLKTWAFLSFHSSQALRRSKEVSPFRRRPFTPELAHLHYSRESKFSQRLASKSTSPIHSLSSFHTQIEYLHLK
jgi:hypothetical protein